MKMMLRSFLAVAVLGASIGRLQAALTLAQAVQVVQAYGAGLGNDSFFYFRLSHTGGIVLNPGETTNPPPAGLFTGMNSSGYTSYNTAAGTLSQGHTGTFSMPESETENGVTKTISVTMVATDWFVQAGGTSNSFSIWVHDNGNGTSELLFCVDNVTQIGSNITQIGWQTDLDSIPSITVAGQIINAPPAGAISASASVLQIGSPVTLNWSLN